MTPEEYEEFVAELVRQLGHFRSARVYRNRRFPGVRQPGEYEIDVAFRLDLGGVAKFLLIIECKHWKRPVDRPVVQKTAQTRDAIGAQKAAIASPVGFTREAVEVAEVHGMALWVIAPAVWEVVMGLCAPQATAGAYTALRKTLLTAISLELPALPNAIVMDFPVTPGGHAPFYRGDPDEPPGMNPKTALGQIVNWISELALHEGLSDEPNGADGVAAWSRATRQALARLELTDKLVEAAVKAVAAAKPPEFEAAVRSALSSLDHIQAHVVPMWLEQEVQEAMLRARFDSDPTNQNAALSLLMHLRTSLEKFERVCRDWEMALPQAGRYLPRRALADRLAEEEELQCRARAVKIYESLLSTDETEDRFAVLHNLAVLHRLQGNIELAEERWRQAYSLDPNDPAVQAAFSRFLERDRGKPDLAHRVANGQSLD